jgi:hypothetical protein
MKDTMQIMIEPMKTVSKTKDTNSDLHFFV